MNELKPVLSIFTKIRITTMISIKKMVVGLTHVASIYLTVSRWLVKLTANLIITQKLQTVCALKNSQPLDNWITVWDDIWYILALTSIKPLKRILLPVVNKVLKGIIGKTTSETWHHCFDLYRGLFWYTKACATTIVNQKGIGVRIGHIFFFCDCPNSLLYRSCSWNSTFKSLHSSLLVVRNGIKKYF